jgi:hypothetical protein
MYGHGAKIIQTRSLRPAIENAMNAIRDLVMDITLIEHGPEKFEHDSFVKAMANLPLAFFQLCCYFFHSK